MTLTRQARTDVGGRPAAPEILARAREIAQPAMQAAVSTMENDRMRLIASYQLGWCDAEGNPTEGGGKSIRPALALLSAEAVMGSQGCGVPGAVAIELVHNFSLLHDDIMDRDVERRHRPTGWVAFGEGQAILAGNAMMGAAVDVLLREGASSVRTVPVLLDTVQQLISGQSADLELEGDDSADVDRVLAMEEGKTAALIAGSLALGALSAGADQGVVDSLYEVGRLVGIAFQLVDDVLGITGDPAVTGKSASSDVRAGKRSAPVVASLRAGTPESAALAQLLAVGPPESDADVARAVALIEGAGGVAWATAEAERLLEQGLVLLDTLPLADRAAADELRLLAEYLVRRSK